MRGRHAEEASRIVEQVGEVRLSLLTDLHIADAEETLARARVVLAGALAPETIVFAVRDHDASVRTRLALTRSLLALARPRGARVVVHDRIDLMLAADADGVHLAQRSVDVLDARVLVGRRHLGRSCHDDAGLAAAGGCDAATLSPLFASPGKGAPLGVARFATLARAAAMPVIALGGITATNAAEAFAAGAAGVATIRGWLVDDPLTLLRAVESC